MASERIFSAKSFNLGNLSLVTSFQKLFTVSIVAYIFIKRCYACSTAIKITYCRCGGPRFGPSLVIALILSIIERNLRGRPARRDRKSKKESRTRDNAAGIGHVCFCVKASLTNAWECQIRSFVHFDVSRACLFAFRSRIKPTSITLCLRGFHQ